VRAVFKANLHRRLAILHKLKRLEEEAVPRIFADCGLARWDCRRSSDNTRLCQTLYSRILEPVAGREPTIDSTRSKLRRDGVARHGMLLSPPPI
jgi:hypothetical protein